MKVDPLLTFFTPLATKPVAGFVPPTRSFEDFLSGSDQPAESPIVAGFVKAPPAVLDRRQPSSMGFAPATQTPRVPQPLSPEDLLSGLDRLSEIPVAVELAAVQLPPVLGGVQHPPVITQGGQSPSPTPTEVSPLSKWEFAAPEAYPLTPGSTPAPLKAVDLTAPIIRVLQDAFARPAALGREGETRAFGFRELGWFDHSVPTFETGAFGGRSAGEVEALPSSADVAADAPLTPLQAARGSGTPADQNLILDDAASANAFARLLINPADQSGEGARRAAVVLAPSGGKAAGDLRDDMAQADDALQSRGGVGELDQPYRIVAGSKPTVSVVVSEGNGSMQVVAAAPEFAADAVDRLREIASEVIAEHGMTLGDFSLNGAKIRPSRLS